jgi:transcriptional regulator with XRE-family HTH domain
MPDFDLGGHLRRIRRRADLSQRQLARAAGISAASLAGAEAGSRDLPVGALVRAAALAGLRLALLDDTGREVGPMSPEAVLDLGGRRFPAHLDTRPTAAGSWLHEHRRDRPETAYTFGRDRSARDAGRRKAGTPEEHHPLLPGDTPAGRRAARTEEQRRRQQAERERRRAAGDLRRLDDGFTCTCPPACDELDDRSGPPVHADDCPCGCDVH